MYKHYIFLILLWCLTSISFGKIVSLSGKKVTLLNTLESKNSFVSYVVINGVRYLVKQKKADNKQVAVIRDALAAYIAKSLRIAHEVDIISYKKLFPGKMKSSWPATIHTIAPGDTVRKQRDSIYSTLRLRQLWAMAKNFEETGLTRDMISQMSWHRQLPIIVALDLIIGNSDRHCGNLCYDPVTDKFCAIDMDDTFNKDLCIVACKKLELMMEDPNAAFTMQEVNALIKMRSTIRHILIRYKPSEIVKKLYHFAKKAGFVRGSVIYTPSVQKKLLLYESIITQSWISARKLVNILDRIIDKHVREVWYVRNDEVAPDGQANQA